MSERQLTNLVHGMLEDALLSYLDAGKFLDWHSCVGPMIDGTNPCEICQGMVANAIAACEFLELPVTAARWRAILAEWKSDPADPGVQ